MSGKFLKSQDVIAAADADQEPDIIEEFLPRTGYGILCGDTGVGKTNEMIHLWYGFASKNPETFHGLKLKQCPCIYINIEDDEGKIG